MFAGNILEEDRTLESSDVEREASKKVLRMKKRITNSRRLTRISSISTLFWFLVLIALVHCNTSIPPPQKRGKDSFLWNSLKDSLNFGIVSGLSVCDCRTFVVLSVMKVKLLYPFY